MTWHSCMFRVLDSGDDLLSYIGYMIWYFEGEVDMDFKLVLTL